MILELQSLAHVSDKIELTTAHNSSAVAQCKQLWKRVYRASLRKQGSPAVAQLDAADAYREAMPTLEGHDNIRDFIACVGYAMAADVFIEETGTKLLFAAQVAISAAGHRKETKKRPRKSMTPKASSHKTLTPTPPSP